MTWDKVMKLRNRIRIFAVIFILALGMEYLPMAVYAAEVTAEESDMANDAEPDMDETPETDNALIIWLGTISRPSVAARDATQFCMALLAASFTDLAS